MKIEIKHTENTGYMSGVEKTEKTWKCFGVVVKRKVYYYPKLKAYDVVTML